VRLADRISKLAERANWWPQPRFMITGEDTETL
jgi:hypothetical protein